MADITKNRFTFNDINGERDGRVVFSDTTNLIEQSVYHYSLQERETP